MSKTKVREPLELSPLDDEPASENLPEPVPLTLDNHFGVRPMHARQPSGTRTRCYVAAEPRAARLATSPELHFEFDDLKRRSSLVVSCIRGSETIFALSGAGCCEPLAGFEPKDRILHKFGSKSAIVCYPDVIKRERWIQSP